MKVREAIRKLRRAGWERIRKSATSHAIWQRGNDRLIISESDPLCTTANASRTASIAEIKRAVGGKK